MNLNLVINAFKEKYEPIYLQQCLDYMHMYTEGSLAIHKPKGR